ncbi:MAG: ATP-binding protein [Burkholderiales bacterium]|nr:ATP-binding protein [Burkholderiales bacterium]
MTQRPAFHRAFRRDLAELPAIVAYTDAALATSALSPAQRQTVHLAIEELFTNMVKYAAGGAPTIALEVACVHGGVDVTLIDSGVERFDPRTAPGACTDAPLPERQPGGLGLLLVRRLVDALRYDYVAERREGRTQFRVAGPC